MSRLFLDIHGLMSVDLDVSVRMERRVRDNLDLLVVDGQPEHPDLIVRDLPSAEATNIFGSVRGVKYRFTHLNYQGREAIALMHRESPVAVLVFGQPLRLFLDRDSKNIGRMYLMFLYTLSLGLSKAQGFLLHGACLKPAEKNEATLFVGRRGSCKTCVGFSLMKEGWQYIGDDKLVLKDSHVYPFEKKIGVRDWHLVKQPWLFDYLPSSARRQKHSGRRAIRSLFRRLGMSFLPEELSARWENKWNANSRVPVYDIFPNVSILPSARVKNVIHLKPSAQVSLDQPPAVEVLARVYGIQEAMFEELQPLPFLCQDRLYGVSGSERFRLQLEKNLTGVSFYELSLPTNVNFDRIQSELRQCLAKLA